MLHLLSIPDAGFRQVKFWKRETRERQTFHYFNQLMTGLKFLHEAGAPTYALHITLMFVFTYVGFTHYV